MQCKIDEMIANRMLPAGLIIQPERGIREGPCRKREPEIRKPGHGRDIRIEEQGIVVEMKGSAQ